MKRSIVVMASSLVLAGAAPGFVFTEGPGSELSDDYLSPTPLNAGAGDNLLTLRASGFPGDIDLFQLIIPSGFELSSIILNSYQSNVPGNVSFFGMQATPLLSSDPFAGGDQNSFSDPVGYVLFGDWAEGQNLWTIMAAGQPFNGAQKLGAGSYAGWIQETGAPSDTQLNFIVRAVPEAGTSILLVAAGVMGLVRRARSS